MLPSPPSPSGMVARPPGPHVEAAGIIIVTGGYKRSALDVARDFVREQSCAEWGDAVVEADAVKLAELLTAWGSNFGGPIIAPLTHGGEHCLCSKGTEEWCRALHYPRKPIGLPARAEPEAPTIIAAGGDS